MPPSLPPSPLRRIAPACAILILVAWSAPAALAGPNDDKLARSTEVLEELLTNARPPAAVLEESHCIAVIPRVFEGALGVGGRQGYGVLSCRRADGQWSPPVFLRITGGSIGLQVGFESTDLVLFVVSERSARSLMRSKFTLGADAKVAAGPVDAAAGATTDARLDAEIYSYANSTGFFAGVSLSGSKLKIRRKEISQYYPERPVPEDLLFGDIEVRLSAAAAGFVDALP